MSFVMARFPRVFYLIARPRLLTRSSPFSRVKEHL
jgi:hypothetical protein